MDTARTPESQTRQNESYRRGLARAAEDYCRRIVRAHYENFPVASILVPSRLRPAVHAIYAFSRFADDFADEPSYELARLARLDDWGRQLEDPAPTHPVFVALSAARTRHDLPPAPFADLLSAFRQDAVKNRYRDFNEVLDYCRRSANPVGRLILRLYGFSDKNRFDLSDAVCTALQLANFWQDVAVDLEKDRIYLPEDERGMFAVTEDDLRRRRAGDGFRALMEFQVSRTAAIFSRGAELGLMLPGRLGAEIRLTWLTGRLLLEKIRAAAFDVLSARPIVTRGDVLRLLPSALSRRAYRRKVKSWAEGGA